MADSSQPQPLLGEDEPAAFEVVRPEGRSAFFLTCDHASARVPRTLGSLGLAATDLGRHIAWDIGAAAVARKLSERLDACAILQNYSRLVIDCNRPPASPQSILSVSETTPIPANQKLAAGEAEARERAVFQPYHARLCTELDKRQAQQQPTVLISVHSFTPVYAGYQRPWHVGVLYNRDARLAAALLAQLRADTALVVGDNEPYSVSDSTDYTLPRHAEQRGLLHVGIELRQDLVTGDAGQSEWAERLAQALVTSFKTGGTWCKFDLATS